MEAVVAEELLNKFEVELGLKTPETTEIKAKVEGFGTEQTVKNGASG